MPRYNNVTKLNRQEFSTEIHTLIFTHIPKCGGTSLHKTFEGLLGKDKYRVFIGPAIAEQDLSKLRGGGGHQRFGNNPLHHVRSNIVYTTVLRNPFKQFISYYYHLKRDEHHILRLKYPEIVNYSPLELIHFLSSIDNRSANNIQSLMLAPKARSIDEVIEHVESNYSIVGTLENYKTYLNEISKLFPLRKLDEYQLNKKDENADNFDFDVDQTRSVFNDQNKIDLQLYKHFSSSTVA
jgi:hypothetical protein